MRGRGQAALGLLALLAAWPVLRAGLPTFGDGLNHFYRLVELDWAVRHGILFPRWLPDLAYGYGSPLFIYYPPLAYYAAEVFRLAGLSFAHSMTAVYALSLALAAWGAYCWARDLLGETGAFVAGAAYAFAPYLYLDVLARGALPEALALGLLPWLFWAYRRVVTRPSRSATLVAILLLTGLILTHTLTALVAAPLVAAYVATLWWQVKQSKAGGFKPSPLTSHVSPLNPQSLTPNPSLLIPILAIFFPALLSAFFWFPALSEIKYVQASQLFIPALDFHNNFLSLGRLLAAPRPFDPRRVFFDFPASLGWPQAALAIFALAGAVRAGRRAAPTAHALFAWGAVLLLGLLTLPISVRVWEGLPGLRYIQFPWRLVGPASLMLAFAAGAGAASFETRFLKARRNETSRGHESGFLQAKWARPDLIVVVSALACWLFSLPWTFSAGFERPADPGASGIARYERESGQLGTTSAGEYVPATVAELPAPASLAARYAESPIPARLDRAALPAQAQVLSETSGLQSAQATVDSAVAYTAVFDWFYYPGWQAEVDGVPAAIRPGAGHGLIEVAAPAGRHTVAIRFGATPARRNAGLVSLLGLVAVVVWTASGQREPRASIKRASETRFLRENGFLAPVLLGALNPLVVSLSLVALLLARAAYLDNFPNPFSHSRFDGAAVAGITTPLAVNFDGRMALLGLDLRRAEVPSGETLDFDLYWRPLAAPLDADYSVAAHLVDADGFLFGQADSQHPGGLPTSRWRSGQYALDRHSLRILPGTPPGTYRLIVGVYRFDTGASLSVRDANDVPQGTSLTVAEITVTRAAHPPTEAELAPATVFNQPLGPLTLVGYDLDPGPQGALAGSPVYLTLYWRAPAGAGASLPPLRARLEVVAGTTRIVSEEVPLGAPDFPVTAWQAGDAVRLPHAIQIPADAPPGTASLRVGLVDDNGAFAAEPVTLATLEISAPQRSTERPDITHPLQADFGGVIRLLGYDLEPAAATPGAALRLTLYWEALAPAPRSYTVFTHLLDSQGTIRGQHDGLPLAGTRPTPSWLPGEVLADTHEFTVDPAAPPGDYGIEVGLYDAASNQRLPVLGPDGQPQADRVLIEGVPLARP